ncbi:hypothetical protein ACQCVK_08830 [Rossellomorea vietnamensis]|nr:hypothetical protein [Rossellomorea aquimaris]
MKTEKGGDDVPGIKSEVHENREKAGFRPATNNQQTPSLLIPQSF